MIARANRHYILGRLWHIAKSLESMVFMSWESVERSCTGDFASENSCLRPGNAHFWNPSL